MANSTTKRCRYCGGTLWLDDGDLKCFSCSRPAQEHHAADVAIARPRLPKLQSNSERILQRRAK